MGKFETGFLLICLSVSIAACVPARRAPAPEHVQVADTARSMKGYDLVSWNDASQGWFYVLVPGTNRLKSRLEILSSPDKTLSLDVVKFRLASLAAGQTVIWQSLPGEASFQPSPEAVREIRTYAESRGLQLIISDK